MGAGVISEFKKEREVSLSLGLFQFDYTAVREKLKEKKSLRNVKSTE